MSEERVETNPFNSLYRTIVYSAADWAVGSDRAWLYGIIVGWDDDSLAELEKSYSWWSKKDSEQLKQMHEQFLKVAQENGCDCYKDDIEPTEEDEEYELPEPFGEKPYRPFQDTAELILHYEKHFNVDYPPFYEPMMWVKNKESDTRFFITGYDELFVVIADVCCDMKKLFDDYVFLDNSPCGIKENEE